MVEAILVILMFVLGTFYGWWLANHQPGKKEEEPGAEEETVPSDMARQWWNIMAYDGTERGQIGADDADYDS